MAIIITEQQLKILEPYAYENYITELVEHCNECYPHLRTTMGEENLRQVLRDAVEKAEESGFTQKGSVQFYIDLLIVFGWDFETDPQYPWIKESIQSDQGKSQIRVSTELFYEVDKYLDAISGKDSEYLFDAAKKLELLTIDNLPVTKNNFIQDMLVVLQDSYPQKYQSTEKDQRIKLIEQGIKKSKNDYQFEQPNHIGLVVILMFLLGHEFDHDPFYKWVSLEKSNQYIEGTLVMDQQETIARKLESRAKIWLAAAVENKKNQLADNNKEKGVV